MSVGEPADAPADAEVEISEVLRLPCMAGYLDTAAPALAAKECPRHTVALGLIKITCFYVHRTRVAEPKLFRVE